MKAGNEARRDRGRGSHPEAEADGYQGKAEAEAATPRPRQTDGDRGLKKQKHDENKRQALLDIIRHNFYDTGLYRGTTAVLLRKC